MQGTVLALQIMRGRMFLGFGIASAHLISKIS
jgi:hypothetical protein